MRILDVVKSKFRKILKLTFTGSVANEAATAPNTVFLLDRLTLSPMSGTIDYLTVTEI